MLEKKIKTTGALKKILASLKARGKRVVFTNGCFDLIHYGHVRYLQEAKNKGDILVVAVNSDSSVKRLKGKLRPIVKEKYRAGVIAALESVDYVVIFPDDTPLKVIKALAPDVLVKGADWKVPEIVGADFVKQNKGRVVTIRFEKGFSTSNLINEIKKRF